jgi:hypothetical protein
MPRKSKNPVPRKPRADALRNRELILPNARGLVDILIAGSRPAKQTALQLLFAAQGHRRIGPGCVARRTPGSRQGDGQKQQGDGCKGEGIVGRDTEEQR